MARTGVLALVVCLALAACARLAGEHITLPLATGPARVGPTEQTLYFALLNTAGAKVNLSVAKPAKVDTPVDVVLLFDRTNSMKKYIENAAEAARDLVAQVSSLAPDSRFAVTTLADYFPSHTPTEPTSVPWQLLQNFTADATAVEQSLKAIQISHGGDGPEAYTTALYESARLPWREKARRILVLLGDSHNHPADPGRDGKEGTADDLRFTDALNELNKHNVTVLGVQAGSYSVSTDMFKTLAQRTEGSASTLDSSDDTARIVQATILTALMPKHDIAPEGSLASWVKRIDPDTADRRGSQSFALKIAVPAGTAAGLYVLPVRVNLLEENGASQSAVVNVRLLVGWINHPLTPFLPLALLLSLAFLTLLRALTKRTDSLYNVMGSGPRWDRIPPTWILALLEMLIYLSLLLALTGSVLLLNKDWIPSDILRSLMAM